MCCRPWRCEIKNTLFLALVSDHLLTYLDYGVALGCPYHRYFPPYCLLRGSKAAGCHPEDREWYQRCKGRYNGPSPSWPCRWFRELRWLRRPHIRAWGGVQARMLGSRYEGWSWSLSRALYAPGKTRMENIHRVPSGLPPGDNNPSFTWSYPRSMYDASQFEAGWDVYLDKWSVSCQGQLWEWTSSWWACTRP